VFLARAAEIKPEWILRVAPDFCHSRYFEPVWNPARGFVEAVVEIRFKGMPIFRKRVDYGKVEPGPCASIFFREAIVEGHLPRPFAFMAQNEKFLQALGEREKRERHFGLVPTTEELVEFFTSQFPEIYNYKLLRDYIAQNGESKFLYKNGLSNVQGGHGDPPLHPENPDSDNHSDNFKVLAYVFDRTRKDDGITIDSGVAAWTPPAKLALELPQWRGWMLDELSSKAEIKNNLKVIDNLFVKLLKQKENELEPPLLLLYEACRQAGIEGDLPSLNTKKEHHLRLHSKAGEISPEQGAASAPFGRPEQDSKTWRERFRPYLAARKLPENTLSSVRKTLAALENGERLDPYPLWDSVRIQSLQESEAPLESAPVETDHLKALKKRFGKLR
jgi:hypothetical protein